MRREFTSIEDDVHQHHRDKFARLAKDHGWISDIRESSKTERCRSRYEN